MNSLFARLFKYRATEGRSPQEDFLTEALAGVLETSLALRIAFAKWLIERDVEAVGVETQKSAESYGRLDLWLEAREGSGERHVVVFENKIWAGEGENQLGRYHDYLQKRQENAHSRTLIYLTPSAHSDFRPADEKVAFRNLKWFQVSDWLKAWGHRQEADRHGRVLAGELLALLEEWNMDASLNVGDLATAVAYRTRVESRLVRILDEVWNHCQVEGSKQNKWSYDYRKLYYRSPNVGAEEELYLQFGFDFASEDEHWSVQRLAVPSAYFALRRTRDGVEQLPGLPEAWNNPPQSWGWEFEAKVKRMEVVEVKGDSLRSAYLDFFEKALKEAEEATQIG